ncbi:MAG: cytochrome P450 [Caulobacterales bacterium]
MTATVRYADIPTMDYDAATTAEQHSFLTEARQKTPLLRLTSPNPERNVLLITDPDDVLHVAAHPEIFSSTGHAQAIRFDSDYDPAGAKIYAERGRNLKNVIVWQDGRTHFRQRKLVQAAFIPRQVKAKESYIRDLIEGLIDQFPADGKVEFMGAFAWQLPTEVIAREYGLTQNEVPLVRDVTNKLSASVDPMGPSNSHILAADAISTLQDLLMEKLEHIDQLPDNTLLKDLALARVEGEAALSKEELMWLSTILLAAGGHTTGAMLGWTGLKLATNPPLQNALRQNPERIPAFVEEMLRTHEPVPTSYRLVTQDTTIRDVEVPKGTSVIIRWDMCNFDPKKFSDPERFDIDRTDVRNHSTFGNGAHFCVGNHLARLELRLATEVMLRRFRTIELTVPAETIRNVQSFDLYAVEALPLHLA